jgi:hypothetical protein
VHTICLIQIRFSIRRARTRHNCVTRTRACVDSPGRVPFEYGRVDSPKLNRETTDIHPSRLFGRRWATHEPSEDAESSDAERASLEQLSRSRWTVLCLDQRPINFCARRRRLRTRVRAPLRSLDPTGHRHIHFRCADGALLRVVNFLAIQTEVSISKLHGSQSTQVCCRFMRLDLSNDPGSISAPIMHVARRDLRHPSGSCYRNRYDAGCLHRYSCWRFRRPSPPSRLSMPGVSSSRHLPITTRPTRRPVRCWSRIIGLTCSSLAAPAPSRPPTSANLHRLAMA